MTVVDAIVLVVAFVLWHVFLWGCACWLLARAAGWKRMVTRYPHPDRPDIGECADGMLMIGEKWNGSVVVHAGEDGLAVGPAVLMSIAHPRFLLPWRSITPLPATHSPVMRATNIAADGQPLSFYGSAADLVERAVARYVGTTSAPRSANA